MTQTPVQLPVAKLAPSNPLGRRFAHWVPSLLISAVVCAMFCAAISVIMLVVFIRESRSNVLLSAEVNEARAALTQNPEDASAQARLRDADQRERKVYFQRRGFLSHGTILLVGGAAVLILCLKLAATFSARPYVPVGARRDATAQVRLWTLASVGMSALVFLGLWVTMGVGERSHRLAFAQPAQPSPDMPVSIVTTPDVPVTPEQYAKNWPVFRGSGGSARAVGEGYPTQWDAAAGKNVLWKVPVPLPGQNSPVVWEKLVFLTGADEKKREVYCFDAETGVQKWTRAVPGLGSPIKVNEDGGYAPNSCATDGNRVYAAFADGAIGAVDFSGKLLWSKQLGPLENVYGHSSSLLTFENLVIVQLDQGNEEKHDSSLIAFDGATGKQVWKTKRDSHAAWSSPILAQTPAGPQIISAGNPLLFAHDPRSGAEIWRANVMHGEVAPSPAYAAGMVLIANEGADGMAIAADGKGDVTASHVKWKYPDDLPDVVSPLATDELMWFATGSGFFTCLERATGKMVYQQDLEARCHASPILVGKHIYLLDRAGVTHVIDAGRTFKAVAKSPIGEEASATPAFVNGRIYIRAKENLYCVGVKP